MYASLLEKGKSVQHPVKADREYYLHLVQDVKDFHSEHNEVALQLNGEVLLLSGDGAFIRTPDVVPDGETLTIENVGKTGRVAEFLLFDIAKNT